VESGTGWMSVNGSLAILLQMDARENQKINFLIFYLISLGIGNGMPSLSTMGRDGLGSETGNKSLNLSIRLVKQIQINKNIA
jgi:hypothetical protein